MSFQATRGLAALLANGRYLAVEGGCDAVIVPCFGDPAVIDLQLRFPELIVIGAGAAAVRATRGIRFGVIAVGEDPSSEPEVGMIAHANGMTHTVAAVSTCGSLVGDCASSNVVDSAVAAANRMIERGAKIVVLGCTGLSPHIDRIRDRVHVPIIDPLAEALDNVVQGVKLLRGTIKPN